MSAKELYDSGNLSGAIAEVTQDVKSNPRDLKSRTFLFELLCFAGEFQRAQRQLDAAAQTSGDVTIELGAQAYRNLLQAETLRREFFTGARRTPKFFSEPPAYTALHIEGVARLHRQEWNGLEQSMEESAAARQPLPGQCNGKAFSDFHDGDDLLSPFLEVFFQSDYYWLPMEQIARVEIPAPSTLRDLLWTPANVQLRGATLGDLLIPAIYYGSHENPDDLVKLGRMTDWKSVGKDHLSGLGQRTFFADDTEYPLLEIRTLEFAAES